MIINATLCYLKKDKQTLMLCRNKKQNDWHRDKWNGLGGKFEAGETPEECAVREISEESGLMAHSIKMKGVLTFPCFDTVNDWIVFVFQVTDFSGNLTQSQEGTLQWINDADLLSLPLWEGDRVFLKWLDNPGFFSGKFLYKDGRLVSHTVSFY